MLRCKISCRRSRLIVDDEVDFALAPQVDGLGAMARYMSEAHCAEHGLQDASLRGAELDELKPIQSQRIDGIALRGRGGQGAHGGLRRRVWFQEASAALESF